MTAYSLLHPALVLCGIASVLILLAALIYGALWLMDWADARWPQGTGDERFVIESVRRPDIPSTVAASPDEIAEARERRARHEDRLRRATGGRR